MVLIPRITFVPLSGDSWPIDWQRKQFPLKPAFVMTINKSQGQTMQMAGLFLRLKMFTHGQLYVAKGQNAISIMGKQEKRVQRNEEDSAKRYSYSFNNSHSYIHFRNKNLNKDVCRAIFRYF